MRTCFSTADVHPRDRLDHWRRAASHAFVELDCRVGADADFHCSIAGAGLGALSVSLVDTDACEVFRTKRTIAGTWSDDLFVSVQLAGKVVLRQHGREAQLDVGDFAVYDASAPYALTVHGGTRQLVLKVPRRPLERRLGPIAAHVARAVRPDAAVGGLASAFLSLLPDRLDSLAASPAAERLAGQAMDMLALGLSERAEDDAPRPCSAARTMALLRLKAVIDERLHDPMLRPALAAELAGVGQRYARELFAEAGTTLSRYILFERLDRCRRAIREGAPFERKVGEIAFAWGFSDLSHFSRAFRARYGISPRRFRGKPGSEIGNRPPGC